MPWHAPGVKPNRTWVYAPSSETLVARWNRLVRCPTGEKSELFRESRDANLRQVKPPLSGQQSSRRPFAQERGSCPPPVRVSRRSFDRQWLIPDSRLLHAPSPALWRTNSDSQIFVSEQHSQPLTAGPGLVFSALVLDMDHYMGHHGGRVLPLYRDVRGQVPNIAPGLLKLLSAQLRSRIEAPDFLAYVAAVVGHSAYTALFVDDLRRDPGIRVPITKDKSIWWAAVELGRELIWLHTFGERYIDANAGRRAGPPRMLDGRPKITRQIPDSSQGMPDEIGYERETSTLCVGTGRIAPVSGAVWMYEVSGRRIVKAWFDYRKKAPAGKKSSPLDELLPTSWTPRMSSELLELLNVLGRSVALEPRQGQILRQVMESQLIDLSVLESENVLPCPARFKKPPLEERAEML